MVIINLYLELVNCLTDLDIVLCNVSQKVTGMYPSPVTFQPIIR